MRESLQNQFRLMAALVSVLLLAGCTVNPVTGERELNLISAAEERSLGEQQYEPTVQSQGGEFTVCPELSEYVSSVGQKLAAVSDQPDLPYEFTIINSSVPNAWALPGGKIAINRGLLLELENEAQLAAVLSHEIVHAAASHSAQRLQRGMLINAGIAGLGIALSDQEYSQILMGGAAVGAQIALAQYSQEHELESDHYGMEYMAEAGYDPQAAVELQRIFLRLSEGQGSGGFVAGLFASHPPSAARVEANLETAEALPEGGQLGAETYREKMSCLREIEPAYDLEAEARKLAQEERYEEALAKINQAIEIAPDEPSFHALRGQLLEQLGRPDDAMESLDRAVALQPDMFSYRLMRGMAHEQQENWDAAEADYKASIASVPTSLAFLGLGDVALAEGRVADARQRYQVAASAGGQVGAAAQNRLMQLR